MNILKSLKVKSNKILLNNFRKNIAVEFDVDIVKKGF